MSNKIQVLDCTLRDGGYVNDWHFGQDNIKKVIKGLIESKVEIVECGFLTKKVDYSLDDTRFTDLSQINRFLPSGNHTTKRVVMINFGEYPLEALPECSSTNIDGIRVAFHKQDLTAALVFCQGLVNKGYLTFIQPMVSVSYSDLEFIQMISEVNKINPYAFYIVDSFGVMKRQELLRLYYLVDHNLAEQIHVGYHSHNNLQLSYANAQTLVDMKTNRHLIIDSSVFGMGRGAGNLNTELFIEYLNDNNSDQYNIRPLLRIIDEVLNPIYFDNYWGYSLPHYISAKNNTHPNYASFLSDKNTLAIEDISHILSKMDETKKNNYDRNYIETLYLAHQSHKIDDTHARQQLLNRFKGKEVILIAPGSSVKNQQANLKSLLNDHQSLIVAVNFIPETLPYDMVFVSNLRRFEEVKTKSTKPLIITSNIIGKTVDSLSINYLDLLNEIEQVKDNAGLMAIKLMIELQVSKLKLMGYDGYAYDAASNYAEREMALIQNKTTINALNKGMRQAINEYSTAIALEFLTPTQYR